MTKRIAVLAVCSLLLPTLPGCVAAIGNSGGGWRDMPATAKPLLQEKVEAARRIVELQQRKLDELRNRHAAGAVAADAVVDAEIAVEEARLRLLDCRAELQAMEGKKAN